MPFIFWNVKLQHPSYSFCFTDIDHLTSNKWRKFQRERKLTERWLWEGKEESVPRSKGVFQGWVYNWAKAVKGQFWEGDQEWWWQQQQWLLLNSMWSTSHGPSPLILTSALWGPLSSLSLTSFFEKWVIYLFNTEASCEDWMTWWVYNTEHGVWETVGLFISYGYPYPHMTEVGIKSETCPRSKNW